MMTSILAAYVSPRKLSSMALYSTVPGKPRESHTRSVWIVQIQPTTDTSPIPRIPHTEVCGLFRSNLLVHVRMAHETELVFESLGSKAGSEQSHQLPCVGFWGSERGSVVGWI